MVIIIIITTIIVIIMMMIIMMITITITTKIITIYRRSTNCSCQVPTRYAYTLVL